LTILALEIFSPEHDQLRGSARKFFEREIVPRHRDWEKAGVAPRFVWKKAGEAGLLCVAKSGVISFTKSLAREVVRKNQRVNCVCPGPTDTQTEKMQEALINASPVKRLGKPSEVDDAVQFFASDRSSFVTGQVLSVSGGLTMVG
jgi:NAD(P)-dependent dehydrogenase (short-subunit alcohol dehydrogenase family)